MADDARPGDQGPQLEAKDLAPAQWKAKFEAIKVKEDVKTP
jgi:hypothetical protein